VDTTVGKVRVLQGIAHPIVNASALTLFMFEISEKYLNNVIDSNCA
jgi:hypothetical protein